MDKGLENYIAYCCALLQDWARAVGEGGGPRRRGRAGANVTGHRSRIAGLDRLLTYIKSKPDVWFATMEQAATYVKQQSSQ